MECEHKFVHLDTKKTNRFDRYNTHYVRVDTFFCERCLEYRHKKQEEWCVDRPDWY